MKKKHIIQIIIGIVLICGIGYAVYQEVHHNKEDYFIIETSKTREEIENMLKGENVEEINYWSGEIRKVNYSYMKIKTKIKTYEKIVKRKEIDIRYAKQTDGLECTKIYVACEILFFSNISKEDKERINQEYDLNIDIKSESKSFYIKVEPNIINKLIKEKFVRKIVAIKYRPDPFS